MRENEDKSKFFSRKMKNVTNLKKKIGGMLYLSVVVALWQSLYVIYMYLHVV